MTDEGATCTRPDSGGAPGCGAQWDPLGRQHKKPAIPQTWARDFWDLLQAMTNVLPPGSEHRHARREWQTDGTVRLTATWHCPDPYAAPMESAG